MRTSCREREFSSTACISHKSSTPMRREASLSTPTLTVTASEPRHRSKKQEPVESSEIDFYIIKQKFLEELESKTRLSYSKKTVSPTLAQLRLTPGRPIEEKRKILIDKHAAAKQNSNKLAVGGGVSIWPDMAKMRLNKFDLLQLITLFIILIFVAAYFFFKIHGYTFTKLQMLSEKLNNFSISHPILISSDYNKFHDSVVFWHADFLNLLAEITESFDMSHPSRRYQIYILLYICGVMLLFYYLFESIYAKNKLSPNRIRRWVSILAVIICWTALMLFLLKSAQNLEGLIESNVHYLNEVMGMILSKQHDTAYFQNVLFYWRTRCLPPSSRGTLRIFDIMSIRDFTFYLQYYSLPLFTVLVSPVIRLVMTLYSMYSVT
ncbi:Hypothetical predicted protein [Octopus vulgaris]|nr:Hypothetical predicted protein [Octopus vulgaris]